MTTHELKTFAPYFDAIKRGEKTFEVRRDDRGFQKGDKLRLVRTEGTGYQPYTLDEQGRRCYLEFEITYVLTGGQFGIEPGYVVLGIKETRP